MNPERSPSAPAARPLRRAAAGPLIVVALALAVIFAGAQSSAARPIERVHHTHKCGQIGSSAGWGYGDIHAHGLSCAAARRVIRHWSPDHPHGWTLNQNRRPQVFHKGRLWISGYALGD